MNKNIVLALASLLSFSAYAEVTSITMEKTANPKLPIVNWVSHPGEEIKIENGNGAKIMIQITVTGSANAPGVTVTHCGQTTSIKSGSSAICTTNDSSNPVTFVSDSTTEASMGTYQITEQ